MGMIFVFSPAAAPSIGALILRWAHWPWLFYALAIFGVLVLIGVLNLEESLPLEKRNDHGIEQSFKNYIVISKSAEFRSAAIIAIGGSFVTFGYVSSSAAVIMGSYGASRAKYGVLFAVIAIGLVASNRFNIQFLSRFGVIGMLKKFTLVQTIGAILVCAASIAHAPLWALLTPIVVCFGCAPGMGGNAMTLGMHPFPEKAGSAAAMLGLMQMVGAGLISAILAAIHQDVVAKMGVAVLVGALISFVQARRIKVEL